MLFLDRDSNLDLQRSNHHDQYASHSPDHLQLLEMLKKKLFTYKKECLQVHKFNKNRNQGNINDIFNIKKPSISIKVPMK